MAYADDVRKLQRQKMLAQMLQQQGSQAMQMPQGGGPYAGGPSKTASVLGALQQIAGGAMQGNAMVKGGNLEDQRSKQIAEQLAAMAGVTPQANQPPAVTPAQAPQAAAGPIAPQMAAPGGDRQKQMAAALSVVGGLPLEQQEQMLASESVKRLFSTPKVDTVDLGGEIGFKDEAGNIVRRVPKSAAPSNEVVQTMGADGKPVFTKRDTAAGQTPFQAEPNEVRTLRTFLSEPKLAEAAAAQKKAGATNVSMSANTERSLYGTMADKAGAANVEQFTQAQKAPQLLQRAQRVKSLLGPDSQAITGVGAEQLLTLSKVASQMGFNTGDAAADTEMLGRELASSTLDAIKASGLGSGSGFSNADRDFLEKAVGGKITMEGETLRRLADLNERAATATIQQWNATASRLDPQQLKNLGMSAIEMPAGTPAPTAKPKLQKNPDGSYTYSP